jgi:putative DNA primase/helicase
LRQTADRLPQRKPPNDWDTQPKSGGILLSGEGIQIQFKPDKPWKNEGDKKAAKYRSPLGDYDAMLPNNPDDPALLD